MGVWEEAITITLRDNEDFDKNIARTMLMMMIMLVKCDNGILKDCNNFAVVSDNDFHILPNLTTSTMITIFIMIPQKQNLIANFKPMPKMKMFCF